MLRLTDITVGSDPALDPVLDGISFVVERGERVALLGANGSGKTTLARVVARLIEPASGSVTVGGGGRVGLVVHDPAAGIIAGRVVDDIAIGPTLAGRSQAEIVARVDRASATAAVTHLAGRDPRTLSGGEQHRVVIAGVLACDVDVLVLDEPTAHLDGAGAARLVDDIAQLVSVPDAPALIWITQLPDELVHCERAIVLDHGRVAVDGPLRDFAGDPHAARSLGVELPAPARLMHALVEAGVVGAPRSAPVTHDELVASLAPRAGRDGW